MMMERNVFKRWFYNYNYSSTEIHNITLRLHEAETRGDLTVHVIYVTSTQMKKLGIDGLSRGEFLIVVMAGKYPFGMLPLDMGALERSEGL